MTSPTRVFPATELDVPDLSNGARETLKSDPDKLLARHSTLVHSDERKVVSHVQRESGEWFINTVLIDDLQVPFRYKRKRRYKSLVGAQVNLTYYPAIETVAGVDLEVMRVVRIRRA